LIQSLQLTLSCRTTYIYISYRTANLQMLHFIYYSTNIPTEYFKHAAHAPFFFLSSKCRLFHNATFFVSCVIHILYTECAKIKKKKSGAKGLILNRSISYVQQRGPFPIGFSTKILYVILNSPCTLRA